MILYDLNENERSPAYEELAASNLVRQYEFLKSIAAAAVRARQPMISTTLIQALNYHAIACLHVNAGEYRPCPTRAGGHEPPEHYRVPELMNSFINRANRSWDATGAMELAAYCLWRLNYVHPFINGNGRTARALCYFVICVKSGGSVQGEPILPVLIKQSRQEYVELLQSADRDYFAGVPDYLKGLSGFLNRLTNRQIGSAPPAPAR